jgi:hypothetical protein
MSDPIEVNYVPDGDDWQVTVSGRGQLLRARAPGLIAARDRADQLVEKVAPEDKLRRVVHLLDGDALEFTAAYLTARLAKPAEPAAAPEPAEKAVEEPPKPIPAPAPRKQSDEPTRAGAKHGAGRDD